MPGPIHQEISLPASPQRVYSALMDSREFSKVTGAPATIDAKDGGAFSCFGNVIVGRNIELVLNQRIVQAWRVVNWPKGVYSIARFELEAEDDDDGTRIIFDHIGFPDGEETHLEPGWHAQYWAPLKKYFP